MGFLGTGLIELIEDGGVNFNVGESGGHRINRRRRERRALPSHIHQRHCGESSFTFFFGAENDDRSDSPSICAEETLMSWSVGLFT